MLKKIKLMVLLSLLIIGYLSSFLFLIWLASLIMFVFSDAENVGVIAYIPKWIFLLSLLSFLEETETLRKFFKT